MLQHKVGCVRLRPARCDHQAGPLQHLAPHVLAEVGADGGQQQRGNLQPKPFLSISFSPFQFDVALVKLNRGAAGGQQQRGNLRPGSEFSSFQLWFCGSQTEQGGRWGSAERGHLLQGHFLVLMSFGFYNSTQNKQRKGSDAPPPRQQGPARTWHHCTPPSHTHPPTHPPLHPSTNHPQTSR